jgi:hypothetical protein
MLEVQQSPSWAKRLRMSQFVQSGKMSFQNVPSDNFPQQPQGVYQILLRDGRFSHAIVNSADSPFGSFWAHPALYLPGGDGGCWFGSDVVAWQKN